MIAIEIQDSASPRLQAMLAALERPATALKVGAQAAANVLRAHFALRESEPNAQNWPKSHFWSRIRGATAVASVSDTEALVAVSSPAFSHKVTGGTIVPKRGKYLAIPAMAAAYAAGSPREGAAPENLAFAFSRHPQGGWRPSLVVQENVMKEVGKPRKDGTRRRRLVHQAGAIWYWLIKSATQAPDPRALPPEPEITDAVIDAMAAVLLPGGVA